MSGMTQTIEQVYADALRLVRVHRLTHDLAACDQEDIAHEALASYLGVFAGGTPPVNAAAWLEVAVRNEAADCLRRRRRRQDKELQPRPQDPDAGVTEVLAQLRGLTTPSLAPVRAGFLERLLGLLNPAFAEVLRLRFVHDLDATEVALRLGIGRAAVDQRVARAKRQLREVLTAHPDLAAELRQGHPRLY